MPDTTPGEARRQIVSMVRDFVRREVLPIAQEYEAKINSGDLISIAEVVRDLHRAEDQPEQSYSERQLYESALDRMARELAAVENIGRDEAMEKLSVSLSKKAA